jgi:4-amino-4-deoxy-L-arabinose transferase-like glycosyltransferase
VLTLAACALALVFFAALALMSAWSKSPTYDEPLHALGAWLHLHHHDFRVNPEDPPLWKYWPALATTPQSIKVDLTPPPTTAPASTLPTTSPVQLDPKDKSTPAKRYALVADDIYHEWPFTVDVLYPCGRSQPADSSNCPDSDALIQRMRAMMLVFGVALGAVIAWWGWKLGGAVAALTAVTLYCLDPNFLAHAPLVKNDVPLSLVTVSLIVATWRAGRRLTIANLLAVALLCAAAVTVKFSGLLLGPIVVALFLLRALDRSPWETFWRRLELRTDKLVMSVLVLILAAGISYGGIWATYLFRFSPSPDPAIQLNLKQMMLYAAMTELRVKHGRMPNDEEIEQWQPSVTTRVIMVMDGMHFLPQAWLNGLLYTYQSALERQTFLMGEYSTKGWWYYFPAAILFKTPLATLLAAALAMGVLVVYLRRQGRRSLLSWTAACLAIPPAFFLASAMRSNLNLGLRHILPVLPFIYVSIGIAATYTWQHRRKPARVVLGVLALGLAVETLASFPNFIPFFNAAAGGPKGGVKLLGDSNLDWGQDLKLLAQWQQDHPNVPLYLTYFGLADPWAYGIRYVNFPGGYRFGPDYEVTSDPGVLAISATHLQGIYTTDEMRDAYAPLRNVEPIDVLGGSIYLYRWPPPKVRK